MFHLSMSLLLAFCERGLVKGLRKLTNTDMRVRMLGSVAVGEREKKEK